MTKKYITELLNEDLENGLSITEAFNSLLEYNIRDLFKMNTWDEPKYYEKIINFQGNNYMITINEGECIEATNEHRIIDWMWEIKKI
jgi:predicted transcriptional regulator